MRCGVSEPAFRKILSLAPSFPVILTRHCLNWLFFAKGRKRLFFAKRSFFANNLFFIFFDKYLSQVRRCEYKDTITLIDEVILPEIPYLT